MRKSNHVEIEEYDEEKELLDGLQGSAKHSTCGGLIVRVSEYLKRPVIEHDLSQILSTYLQFLHESEIYLQNGIFTMNFAEAALLLQNSVQLYSKKVDLFWDVVIEYLNRNLKYEVKTEENQHQFDLLEIRKEKFKRKRKIIEDLVDEPPKPKKTFLINKASTSVQGMTFEDFQQYLGDVPTPKNDSRLNGLEKDITYEQNWAEKNRTSLHSVLELGLQNGKNVPGKTSLEVSIIANLDSNIPHIEITGIQHDLTELNAIGEKEPMGDYGTSSAFNEINHEFHSEYHQVHSLKIPASRVTKSDVQETVLQHWLTEKSMNVDQVYRKWAEFTAECRQLEDSLQKSEEQLNTDGSINHGSICGEELFDSMMENECELDGEGFTICSTSRLDLLAMHSEAHAIEEINKELGAIMEKKNDSIRKRVDSDIESGVFDSLSISTGATPIKDLSNNRPMSILSDGIGAESRNMSPVPLPTALPTPSLSNTIIEEENCLPKIARIKKRLFASDSDEEEGSVIIAPKRPRRRRVKPERLRPVITADLQDFKKFFYQHYTPEDGEGEVEPFHEEQQVADNEDEEVGDLSCCLDDSAYISAKSLDATLVSSASEAEVSQEVNLYCAEEERMPRGENGKSFAEIMDEDETTRLKDVLDWRKFMVDKLNLQRHADFDVHAEETRVIEHIGTVGDSIKFTDLCADNSAAQVSHSFMAMLHLASAQNVALSGFQSGRLSNDSLELKLLSTDQHHEHLHEYNAPSVEAIPKKMASIKNALLHRN